MKLHQLSVFLENKPGQLHAACQLLADAGLNILTLSLADTKQYGILRLILQDWQRGRAVLEKAGLVVKVTEVLALEIDNRPGGLAQILDIIGKANLNVEYMYAFAFGEKSRAVMIFRFDQPDAAVSQLQTQAINPIGSVELYSRLER